MTDSRPPPPGTSPARYVIYYTIHDGENEYTETIREQFNHEPSEEDLVLAVAGNYCFNLTEDVKREVLSEWNHEYTTGQKNAHFTIPGDYRMVDDIESEIEAQHRILITVKGGVAEYAADQNVEVCLIDWDSEPDQKIPAEFAHLLPRASV